MADIDWTDATGDSSFDDSKNWSSGSVPGAGDEVVILLPGTITTGGGEEIDTLTLGLGATLVARNFTILGVPDADNETGTTTVAGTLVVADDSTFSIAGTLDNTGMVQLASSYYGTDFIVGNATVSSLTLTGGGTIALSDLDNNDIIGDSAGAVLDNLDNTIEGSGQIGNSNLSVVNAGTIAATGTAATLILAAAGVTNTALIEATGPAGLEIRDTVMNAGGTIAAVGGHVDLESGADIVGGTLAGTGAAVVLSGTPLLDGATDGAITLLGTAELADDNDATAIGTLTNDGTLLLDATYYGNELLVGDGTISTLTLTGGGIVEMTDIDDNNIVSAYAGSVLDNTDNTIEGSGNLGNANLTILNAGTIAATGTAASLILQAAGVTNTALIEALGTAGLVIRDTVVNVGGTILTLGGDVDLQGGADIVGGTLAGTGAAVVLSGTPLLDGATDGAITLLGTAELADDNSAIAFGTLVNDGTLLLDATYYGADLLVGSGTVSTLTLAGGGTVALSDISNNDVFGHVAGATLDNTDNTIEGSGNLGNSNLAIVNTGTIAAIGTAASLVLQAAGVTNTALIEALGTAGLVIVDTVANAGGTIAAVSGNVDLQGGADIIGGTLVSTGGVFALSGTPLLDGATSGAILLQGTAEILDDNSATAFGTLVNDGTLLLDASYYGTNLQVGSGSVSSLTLTGGGVLALSDISNNNVIGNFANTTLDNLNDTIEGSGNLGNGNLTVVNAGTIVATGTAASLILVASVVTNTALVASEGPAGLVIRDTVVNAGATIAALGGNVDLESGADIIGGTLVGAGGVFLLSGTPVLDGATGGAITLQGTAELGDDNSAILFGTLANDGALLLDSTYYGTDLVVGNGTVTSLTLTGGGTVALTDITNNIIIGDTAGSVLDNTDNTIEGSGTVGNSNLAVVNAGTIAATGTAASLVLQAASVTNTALMEAVGIAGLVIVDSVVNAGGTIAALSGNVDLEGGADIIGGTLDATGGVFTLSGTPVLDGATDGAILLLGTAELLDDNDATLFGTLANEGTLLLDSTYYGTNLLVGNGTVSTLALAGGGTVVLTDITNNNIISGYAGSVLDNTDNTIEGAGNLGNGDLTVINAGTIMATGTAATLILYAAGVTNTALIEAAGPAGLEIRDGVDNAGGTISAVGGNVDLESGGTVAGGTLLTANGDVVRLTGGGVLDGSTDGAITLAGTAELTDDNTATLFGTLTNEGTLVLNGTYYGDTLYVGSGTLSTLTLAGAGTVALSDYSGNDIVGGVAGAVLDNTNDTIAGAGYVGDGDLSIENAGTIAATGTSAGLVISGPTLTNTNLVEAVGPAGLTIESTTVSNTGTILAAAAAEVTVTGPITDAGQLALGALATMVLEGSVAAGQTVDFEGASTLRLTEATMFGASLAGLVAGVTIDLPDYAITAASLTPAALDLVGNFGSLAFPILGSDAGESVLVEPDGTGGTEVVVYGGTSPAPCFCPGTRIATPDGERDVAALAIGDAVLTRDGASRRIRWLGRRRYDARIAARAPALAPVRIRAGALGEGVPRRDLDVSPLHAMLVEGHLVAAGRLVNGVSITRPVPEGEVQYIHIELDTHDIIFAEGAATETYVDCGNRDMFHNADEYASLYPGQAARDLPLAAPLLEGGAALARIRAAIDARAGIACVDADATGAVHGHADEADVFRITGWAVAPGAAGPVLLAISEGGRQLGTVVANAPRPDVAAAGFGDGYCGFAFAFDPPLSPFRRHEISVCRRGDGAALEGSPLVIEPATGVDAADRGLIERSLSSLADATSPGAIATIEDTIAMLERTAETLRTARLRHETGASVFRARTAAAARKDEHRPVAVFIDDHVPSPDRDAGSQVALSHARALVRLGFCVLFVPADLACDPARAASLAAMGIRVAARPHETSVEAVLARLAPEIGLVVAHRIGNAEIYLPLARRICPQARTVFLPADLHFLRTARQAACSSDPYLAGEAERLRRREIVAAEAATVTLVHSDYERELLASLAPRADIRRVGWDVAPIALAGPEHAPPAIGFVGGFRHAPNVDAVAVLALAIAPLVWRARPDAVFRIFGADAPPRLVRDFGSEHFRFEGHVADRREVYQGLRTLVAPLRFGAGVKGKVLEAMAAGRPVVCSWVAAEGAGLPDELAGLVSDDPATLARYLVRLLDEPDVARKAGRAGLATILSDWSRPALDAELATALRLTGRSRGEVAAA